VSAGLGEISGDSYGFEPVAVKGQFRLFGGLAYVSRNLHKFILLLDFKSHRSYTCLYALRGEGEVFRYRALPILGSWLQIWGGSIDKPR